KKSPAPTFNLLSPKEIKEKLDEYIVFQDDKAKRKYIVFKFVNNVTQQLLGMQFEVCQYNVEGNLIEKSQVIYNKFLAGAEEEFVPKAKLRVSYKCDTISVRLIQAAFDRFVWKEGEYEDNCYKFDHFFHDEQILDGGENLQQTAKAKKVKEPKEKKEKRKKSKRPFIMRDATKKNFAGFPVFFNVLIFLVVIGFAVGSLLIFKTDAKKFTSGDYQLRIISESNVAVYGYTGSKSELVIPEEIGGYKVQKIDGGAFVNSKIESLRIDCDLTIETGAFVNCKNLTTVSSSNAVIIMEGAFNGCTSITRTNCPNAYIYPNAFINGGN
ncbi:MAG: leucine-rich repeat protein, partial [Clostridia bacterium]|nr:leucine-rich repeat protein [Clostridia bacterium]